MVDFGLQRRNMVESQVRPSDVTDRRITAAMQAIPRERFVPATLAGLAYSDEVLDFDGAFMVAPRVLARLVQLAAVDDGDKVLVIGSSPGYAAAVLANLAGKVVALVSDPGRRASSDQTLRALGIENVEVREGPLHEGWTEGAPYDAILIEGAVETVPENVLAQLGIGARLVAVERIAGIGRALLLQRSSDVTDRRMLFELAAPLLPEFAQERALFAF